VELAAGTGRFAHAFLRALIEIKRALPLLEPVRIRYVLTDLASSNVDSWPRHERLAPLAKQGLLDFARFDIEHDHELKLLHCGEIISPGSLANPLVALANYAFDTTVHDAFQVRSGALHELRLAVSARQEESLEDPEVLGRLHLGFEEEPLASAEYYDDPVANRVLASYRSLPDTTLLMPTGALRCVRAMLGWSPRLLLLCGDRAFSDWDELGGRKLISALRLHGGSFSLPVNLHALGEYFREIGGQVLHSSRRDFHFKVAALVAGLGDLRLADLRLAFAEEIDSFGPGEYYHLSYALNKEHPQPSLDVLLSLFRLGGWDAELVSAWGGRVAKLVRESQPYQREELRRGLRRAMENYFPLHDNAPLALASIAVTINAADEAIEFAQESLRVFGQSAPALAIKAVAHAALGQRDQALRCAEMALALQPDNAPARQLKERLTVPRQRAQGAKD